MSDFDLCSVIIPAHNCEATIKRCIDSALNQTYSNKEIIVCIDNCNDRTLEIVSTYGNKVKCIINDGLHGAAYSRNKCIESSKGRFLAFLDSDDEWDKEKLLLQLSYMTTNGYLFSYTNYYVKRQNNTFLYRANSSVTFKKIIKHSCIGCSTVIIDRKNELKNFSFPTNAPLREDLAAWIDALKVVGKANLFPYPLTYYYLSSGSVSANKFKMAKFQWCVLRKRENIPFYKSIVCIIVWAIKGFFKYRFPFCKKV